MDENIKSKLQKICVLFLIVTFSPSLSADMIDDTLIIRRAFPNISTDFSSPVSTTVVAGVSDIVTLQPPFWIINPEANNIIIDVEGNSAMGGDSDVFDGIVFTGFSNEISNASVVTDVGGLVHGLEFGTDVINLNMNGTIDPTDFINIQVDFVSVVPEPATYALFLTALIGLGVVRRKRKSQIV